MKGRIWWKELKASYAFRPSLWVIGLVLLALGLGALDRQLSAFEWWSQLPTTLIGGAEGARTMLNAIATAVLTVAALSYSVIMLAVVQTANAYSPRLLDEYLSDSSNQHVLGILLGTFLYTLLVLQAVRSLGELEYVPAIMVSGAFILAALSVAAFIYFINHVAHSIEVSSIVSRIHHETEALVREHPLVVGEERSEQGVPVMPTEEPDVIQAPNDGYIEAVDTETLFNHAVAADVTVQIVVQVGGYIVMDTPLFLVWPAERVDDTLRQRLQQVVSLGDERVMVQDILYGMQQLADVALRAVSPAINDPSTAISCIDGLTSLMVQMARRPEVSRYRYDESGQLRMIVHYPDLEATLDVGFNPIRYYARTDAGCTLRLIDACRDIGNIATRESDRATLWEQVERTAYSASSNLECPWERTAVNQHLHLAAIVLERDPAPLLLQDTPAGDG